MDPHVQNEAPNAQPGIGFDLEHFPESLERAEKVLKVNRRLIEENDVVSIAHLQTATDALFDLMSHAETLHTSSMEMYAKLRDAEEKHRPSEMDKELSKARKRVKNLQKKMSHQRNTIKRLRRRIELFEVPTESTDKLWIPLNVSDNENFQINAWFSPTESSSPDPEYTTTWDPWIVEDRPATWEEDKGQRPVGDIDETWELPEETPVEENPEAWRIGYVTEPDHICYVPERGVEVADLYGKCDSAFVGLVEPYRECVIRRSAFACMVEDHAVVPCVFRPYKPFRLEEPYQGTEITYFGFHYPDGTTLPYLPVRNVKVLYKKGLLQQEPNPWILREAHPGIDIELSEQVFNQIERNSVEMLRESILSGVEKDSEEYYDLVQQGCTRIQGPEMDHTRNGRAYMVVDLNPQCYVRKTVDGRHHTLGLLNSIMTKKQADLEADATFFVRAIKRREIGNVPIITLKLNSIYVDGDQFEL